MKTTNPRRINVRRIFSRRLRAAHNPWLILNMELFNFGNSLSQIIARQQVQQLGR